MELNNREIQPLMMIDDVCRVFNIKKTTVYAWIKLGRLPKPLKLSAKAARWSPESIKAAYDRFWSASDQKF